MDAQIKILYKSDFCEVKNFVCQCTDCTLSRPEYQDVFSICYIRKGNFLFKVFRNNLDSHTGHFLINKPHYEHRVAHLHNMPDECTIISFTEEFYIQLKKDNSIQYGDFFHSPDKHSLLIMSTPRTDYLQYRIFESLKNKNVPALLIDCMIMELAETLFFEKTSIRPQKLSVSVKKNYLIKIEDVKNYIHKDFAEDISLSDLSMQAFMSPFHFSRVFRQITRISPYQYLLQFRLSHAEHLLKNTTLSILDISSSSGFKNPDYFSSAFTKKNKIPPSKYKAERTKI